MASSSTNSTAQALCRQMVSPFVERVRKYVTPKKSKRIRLIYTHPKYPLEFDILMKWVPDTINLSKNRDDLPSKTITRFRPCVEDATMYAITKHGERRCIHDISLDYFPETVGLYPDCSTGMWRSGQLYKTYDTMKFWITTGERWGLEEAYDEELEDAGFDFEKWQKRRSRESPRSNHQRS